MDWFGCVKKALMTCDISITIGNDGDAQVFTKLCGNMPVMVGSELCNLHGMSKKKIVSHREEENEVGGYFILNGRERLIRLLNVPKRNTVFGLERPAMAKRGSGYTRIGCYIRSVREDQTSVTLTMHYLATGALIVRFSILKQEFLIPLLVLMNALVPTTGFEIFTKILGTGQNTFVSERLEVMMRGN